MLVLHFVPQAAQAISKMRRVAKPGGVVVACVWDIRGGLLAGRHPREHRLHHTRPCGNLSPSNRKRLTKERLMPRGAER
jgi:ubiquinone/menaquinone biosynthesis C-methylase UbiE